MDMSRDIGAYIDVYPLAALNFADAEAEDTTEKVSLILDTWGGDGKPRYNSVSFWLSFTVTLNAAADTLVVDTAKLEEDDAANMSGATDIWTAQTLLTVTAAGATETTTSRVHIATYDLGPRKRYLRLTFTPTITEAGGGGVSTAELALVAVLGNPDVAPAMAELIAA